MSSSIGASVIMWKYVLPFLAVTGNLFAIDNLATYFYPFKRFHSKGGGHSYSYSSANGGGMAQASSSFFTLEGIQNQISNAAAGIPDLSSRFADVSDGNGGAAAATGFIGNGEVRQSAAVYPHNPNSPNINTRFGATDSGKEGGNYGVFTSSFSETVPGKNGKPVTVQRASTTVNDNGKITSYTAHNP